LYADTGGDLNTVGRMLTHAPGSPMTLRYSLGAVPEVLRAQMKKFATTERRKSDAPVTEPRPRSARQRRPAVPLRTKVVPIFKNS